MLDRLTPLAFTALDHACRESLRFHRDQIEPDCLALGLLRVEATDARAAVLAREIVPEALCTEVERRIRLGENWRAAEPLSLSEELEALLMHALRAAYPFAYAGTKHLLLSLIERDRGPAREALAALGLAEDAAVRGLLLHPDTEQPRQTPHDERLHAALRQMNETSLRVLALARTEAEKRGAGTVACRDVLLAVGTEGSGLAARELHDAGWNLARLERLPAESAAPSPEDPVFTRPASLTLIQAHAEAERLAQPDVHANHLLLALLRAENVAAAAMRAGGADLDALRHALEAAQPPRRLQKARLVHMTAPPHSPGASTAPAAKGTWSHFSPQAERAMELARQAALEFAHTATEPEHLLLALARNPSWDAARALAALQVDLEALELDVQRELHPAPWMQPIRTLPLAGPTRRVLEHALAERNRRGAPAITTGLLLLGIVRMPSTRAAQLLARKSVTDEALAAALTTAEAPA